MTADGLRRGLASRSYWALMAAQFLGAFNDNALRFVVGLMVVRHMGLSGTAQVPYLAAVTAVFALPFILFATLAGHLADRYSKRSVIVWSKAAEIAVAALATAALWSGNAWVSLATVFLMGTQAAFFSPGKYGILPEILSDAQLSRGNGLVELFSELAIILGSAAGGLLMQASGARLQYVGLVLAGIAVVGTLSSLLIERLPAADPERRVRWNFAAEAWANLREVRADRALFLALLGVSYFWLMAALFQLNFMVYGVRLLLLDNDAAIGGLMAVGGLGIGAGAGLAGWLSGGKVELRLVPIGAAAMAAFSADLFFAHRWGHPLARTAADLFLLGAGAGLYLVPLLAFVQQRSPRGARGRVLATTNLVSFSGIILGAGFFAVLGTRLDPAQVYLFLSLLTVGVGACIFTLRPKVGLRAAKRPAVEPAAASSNNGGRPAADERR